MFCPKCGLENLVDQKFCRGCGHELAGHRAALENKYQDAVGNIKSGSTALGAGAVGPIVISLMALGVWLSQNDAGVFFTLVPVLAFAIPATTIGLIRLNRAYRALIAADRGTSKAPQQSKTTAVHLAEGARTDPLDHIAQLQASVTEHTTLNLESRAPASAEVRNGQEVDSSSSPS